ncbi:DNA-binding transcriptional regulator, XRE-family HTH domain [Pseudobutyrivibrio xylanivorans]|uniref:DNA-binding transcriptional regulator, XRE-family HTH domain n=2 Tax=Pseudobutyrivibrio xylanivorans TaxID=185007 RepID=A0A1G5RZB0_PSEXY|nr:DNA-binding transcriptional regulator, XRE-family HTH domain [Pseudobutyrivibrio xylanivorans]
MEFGEKLLELRNSKGMTQEELAEALFVSRTAISKWESGRGYPSIDSLKEISKFFSVSIDELLSSEKLVTIAEKENRANIRKVLDYLLGLNDLLACGLIFLPLFPHPVEGMVYAVSLIEYSDVSTTIRLIYWILFAFLVVTGAVIVVLTHFKCEKAKWVMIILSMGISIVTVLVLAITRAAYATSVAFILMTIKGLLLLKREKT